MSAYQKASAKLISNFDQHFSFKKMYMMILYRNCDFQRISFSEFISLQLEIILARKNNKEKEKKERKKTSNFKQYA